MSILSDDVLETTYKAFQEAGYNQTRAASVLGISRSTLQERLAKAATRGKGSTLNGTIAPGFSITKTTTLYGEEGSPRLQWVQAKPDRALEDMVAALKETFSDYKGMAVHPTRSGDVLRGDLLTVYPVADLHLGMYSWSEETGNDYDLDIASNLLRETMGSVVAAGPNSETGVVLNLGDFFHSDSNENRTRRSGNSLDVDTRYAKVLRTGVRLLIDTIQQALTKHEKVIVRNIPGNHDPYAALALTLALSSYYSNSDRVLVDDTPSPFWFYRFGGVLLGATHGDMAKAEDMPGIMAAKVPEWWGQTTWRYIFTGHLHKKMKKLISESSGATVEVAQTVAPRDAWGNSMGFVAGRSMQAVVMHRDKGEVARYTEPVFGGA